MSKRICVFCGSNNGKDKIFRETAIELGRLIAFEKMELVYGGGKAGLMGAVADSVLENGGKVIGIIPDFLKARELCHTRLSELIITDTMHDRKSKMYALADYFLVLPGGIGTLDEFAETLTWSQLSIHGKPCGLLNVNGYYDYLLKFMDNMVTQNFFEKENLEHLIVDTSSEKILEKFHSFRKPA
ncbi:MAG: TIGR00730 family Rossman fold protein [Endomicrobia bacterium]|nr:TIGR00730 family Rossman fold protein [Endomicrobiia bacterium]MCL2507353.1 TIGR00730 family Rossman fold protein [Endomicrobiia bacterium]